MSSLLDDATDAFLDTVSERQFDEPFMALLRAEGYKNIQLTHGTVEFGKDFTAQKDREQWVFQSKSGNIGLPQWRSIKGQIDELRLSEYVGPEFDLSLPRRCVLVTTGRLVGGGPLAVAEYNKIARNRHEPEVEVWSRDRLVDSLSASPTAVLRGSVDGGVHSILAAVIGGKASMDSVSEFGERWDDFSSSSILSLGIIEAYVVASHLELSGRDDLACHMAACLVRSAWAGDHSREISQTVARAGRELFDEGASRVWEQCDDELLEKRGLLSRFSVSAGSAMSMWANYLVLSSRILEIVSLFGLRRLADDPETAAKVANWVARFVKSQPGAHRPLSDRYAVGLIPTVLLLSQTNHQAARALLVKTSIWMCDRYEPPRLGIERHGADPKKEIERVFGYMFEHIPMNRRRDSQLACVLLDLARSLKFRKTYADIRNDQLAVEIIPAIIRTPSTRDRFSRTGNENRLELNPSYADELSESELESVAHHRINLDGRKITDEHVPAWDLLAASSALRDRHYMFAINRFAAKVPIDT